MEIISNGSKWAGEAPDSIDHLLEVLENHPLDIARFGAFGFCSFNNNHEPVDNHWNMGEHEIHCRGNFYDISHVFDIRGKYKELENIVNAIEKNIKKQMDSKR